MRALACGILHPARILRGGWHLDVVSRHYLDRARGLLESLQDGEDGESGEALVISTLEPPPGAILQPTLRDLTLFRAGPLHEGVSVDIENAGPILRCVGFCRVADLVSICVPFRTQGGGLYWKTQEELLQAIEWVDELLGNPNIPLVMHNGQSYDVLELRETGFQVEGFEFDTLLAQHVAYPELPKGLQLCSTFWLNVPVWKGLEEVGEGK